MALAHYTAADAAVLLLLNEEDEKKQDLNVGVSDELLWAEKKEMRLINYFPFIFGICGFK